MEIEVRNYCNDYSLNSHYYQFPHNIKVIEFLHYTNLMNAKSIPHDKQVRNVKLPEYTSKHLDPRTYEQYYYLAKPHTIVDKIKGDPNELMLVAFVIKDPKNYVMQSRFYLDKLHKAKDNEELIEEIQESRKTNINPEPGITYVTVFEVPKFVAYSCLEIRKYMDTAELYTPRPLCIVNSRPDKLDPRGEYDVEIFRKSLIFVAVAWFELVFHNNMTYHNDADICAAIIKDFYNKFSHKDHLYYDWNKTPMWDLPDYVKFAACAKDIGYSYLAIYCINTIRFDKKYIVEKHKAQWLKSSFDNYKHAKELIGEGANISPEYYHDIK
jgi:hypothetical protein